MSKSQKFMAGKQLLAFFFLCFIYQLKIQAQKLNDSLLIGSWQLVDYEKNYEKNIGRPHESMFDPDYSITITLYKNHVYQKISRYKRDSSKHSDNSLRDGEVDSFVKGQSGKKPKTIIYSPNPYVSIEGGKWESDKRGYLWLTERHSIQDHPYIMEDEFDKVYLLKDSLLILSTCTGKFKSYFDYNKIKFIPSLKDTYKPSKQCEFYLVNTTDSLKKVSLANGTLSFITHEKNSKLGGDSTIGDINASIESINDSNIVCHIFSENYTIFIGNYSMSTKSDFSNLYDSTIWRSYKIRYMDYIKFSSGSKTNINGFGTVLTTIGTISSLVVAPLISINFKTGSFNSKRYIGWVGGGIVGIGIGIPLIIASQDKQYRITKKNQRKDKNYWYLESR